MIVISIIIKEKYKKHLWNDRLRYIILITGDMDNIYYLTPDLPSSVWITSSVIFGFTFSFGTITNLIVVFAYIKNATVRILRDWIQ